MELEIQEPQVPMEAQEVEVQVGAQQVEDHLGLVGQVELAPLILVDLVVEPDLIMEQEPMDNPEDPTEELVEFLEQIMDLMELVVEPETLVA